MNCYHLKYFTFLSLLIIYKSLIYAENGSTFSITPIFGISNFHILDEHAGYLIFRGTGIAPELSINRAGRKYEHILNGGFFYSNLKTSADNFKTELSGGRFRYSCLMNNASLLSAGLSVSSFYIKTDYLFFTNVYELKAIESWYWNHSINITAKLKKEWAESQVSMIVHLPVVSNLSRPEYSSSGDYNYEKNDWDVKTFGETMSVFKNPAIDLQFNYSRNLSGKFDLNAQYEFLYSSFRKAELIRFYFHNLKVGLTYKF